MFSRFKHKYTLNISLSDISKGSAAADRKHFCTSSNFCCDPASQCPFGFHQSYGLSNSSISVFHGMSAPGFHIDGQHNMDHGAQFNLCVIETDTDAGT